LHKIIIGGIVFEEAKMQQLVNHFLLFLALVIYLFPYLVVLFFLQRIYNLFRRKKTGYMTKFLVEMMRADRSTAKPHERI